MRGPLSRTERGLRAAPALPGLNGNRGHLKKAATRAEPKRTGSRGSSAVPEPRGAAAAPAGRLGAEGRGAGTQPGRKRFHAASAPLTCALCELCFGSRHTSMRAAIAQRCATPILFWIKSAFGEEKNNYNVESKRFYQRLQTCISSFRTAGRSRAVTRVGGPAEGPLAGLGSARFGSVRLGGAGRARGRLRGTWRGAAFPQRLPGSSRPPPFRVPVAQSSISVRNVSCAVAAAHAELRSVALGIEPLPLLIYEVLRRRRAAVAPIVAHAMSGPAGGIHRRSASCGLAAPLRPAALLRRRCFVRPRVEVGCRPGFGAVRAVRGSAVYRTSGRSFICRKDFLLICL